VWEREAAGWFARSGGWVWGVGCGVCREGARKGVAGLLDLKMKIEDIPAGVKTDNFC